MIKTTRIKYSQAPRIIVDDLSPQCDGVKQTFTLTRPVPEWAPYCLVFNGQLYTNTSYKQWFVLDADRKTIHTSFITPPTQGPNKSLILIVGVAGMEDLGVTWDDIVNKPEIPTEEEVDAKDAAILEEAKEYSDEHQNVQANWSESDSSDPAFIKNKPTIPTVNNATLTIQKNGTTVKTFTANASSNVTANITVPTKTSDLTNDSGFLDSVAWGDVTGKPTFATVATSGSYNDLSNKPTIPTVNNATLTIQKNGSTVGTFTANASSNATANITVPTKTSDVTNDSGFLTPSTLPIAGAGVLGAISVGAGLEISSGGVLSATGGGTADAVAWGNVTGTLADQTDLQTVLNGKQASLSTAQLDAANSGITSAKVSTYDGYASTIARKANSADVPVIKMQTTDPGEGATLAANTFIGVYNG